MNFEVHHGGNSLEQRRQPARHHGDPELRVFEVLLPAAAQKYGLAEDIEVDARGLVHAPDGRASALRSTSS